MNKRALIAWLFLVACIIIAEAVLFPDSHSLYRTLALVERKDGTIDHLKLWSRLGVKSHLFDEYPKADLFTFDTGSPHLAMIRLSDRLSCKWQFLLFSSDAKGSLHFLGNIDLPDTHYEPPEHQLRELGSHIWLKIEHVSVWGTGIYEKTEEWYDLGDHQLKPAIGYSTKLKSLFLGDNISVEYSVLSNDLINDNNLPVLTLRTKISIESDREGDSIENRKPAREHYGDIIYKFNSKDNIFYLDNTQSDPKTMSFLDSGILP